MPASTDNDPASAAALSALASFIDRFDRGARQRGREYFEAGRVLLVDAFENQVLGSVRGSIEYDTFLVWTNGRWFSECDCPLGGDCKHAYAAGRAWLRKCESSATSAAFRATPTGPASAPRARTDAPATPPADRAAWQPHEQPLVDEFRAATGHDPDRKQLAWLRNLAALHRSVSTKNQFGYAWLDYQALHNLAPANERHRLPYGYRNPFENWWTRPPATPLQLWSFVALLFSEAQIAPPAFAAPFTDLATAQASRRAEQREKELAAWRHRFSQLEATIAATPTDQPPPPLCSLRLVITPKKIFWEISRDGLGGAFQSCPADRLRPNLTDNGTTPLDFDEGSNILLNALRKRYRFNPRVVLKLSESDDAELIGHWLAHPIARRHIVGPGGASIEDDPRTVTWHIADHPDDAAQVLVSLVFADGTPLPAGAVELGGTPTRYLCGNRLHRGAPPLGSKLAPTPVPREVLTLPEAGRFAARAGLKLPGDTAGRFREEPLRARFRATVVRPRSLGLGEPVKIDLEALSPDGEIRARYAQGAWTTQGKGIQRAADAAFVLHDFGPLAPAAAHLGTLPCLTWIGWPENAAGYYRESLSLAFAEQFSAWLAALPRGTAIDLDPELAAFAAPPTHAHFALEIEASGIDWFGVHVSLRADDTTLTAEEIALLRAARGRFVRLTGRGWRRLELSADSSPAAALAQLGLDAETLAATPAGEAPRLHALQLADPALGDALPEKLAAQIRARAAEIRAIPPPAVPAALRAELRPYQIEGFHFLAHLAAQRFGGILADDMGLGKTLQTLTWLLCLAEQKAGSAAPAAAHDPREATAIAEVRNTNIADSASASAADISSDSPRKKRAHPKRATPAEVRITNIARASSTGTAETTSAALPALRALVVCPKSVVFNWESETARFAPTLTTGRLAPRTAQPVPAAANLVVVNYAQLRLNADALAAESWDAVILDEGQNIKNPASATAAAARALRATHRIVLTGTPVENRLLDLWSLFAFAQPGLLGGQTAFKRLYDDRENPAAAHARLSTRVRHFLLRRTKAQVAADLPPRTEEDIVVELDGSQRKLYDAELKRARQLVLGVKDQREFDAQRFNILQSLLRLRQICCDPRLLGADLRSGGDGAAAKGKTARARAADTPPTKVRNTNIAGDSDRPASDDPAASARKPTAASAKLEALLDTLEPLLEEGHRVLVFSQFVTMLGLIHEELVARDIAHLTLTGQTENRQELVEKFQSADGPPVFLLSLKAAGSGLNLTAASYVVLFDPWWNPAVEAQAIDRTHRIGQTAHVIAYRLLARDTVEEKIRALQKEKAALAAAVVQEESLARVLDLESLKRILS